MTRKLAGGVLALAWMCLIARPAGAAQPALSQDDVTLLLIGGASPQKLVTLIEERGINFPMSADREKKFRADGAEQSVIDALNRASQRLASPSNTPSSPPPPSHATKAEPSSRGQPPASVQQKINETLSTLASHPMAEDQTREEDYPLAPDFALRDLAGHEFSLSDYKGKVVLLDFWATWCHPCRQEIPDFVQLQADYRRQGFQAIGLSVDGTSGPVKRFYTQYAMNYPVAMASSRVRKLYGGIYAVPTTLLIDRQGRIRMKVAGAPVDLSGFKQQVARLVGAPGPPPTPLTGIAEAKARPPAPPAAPATAQPDASPDSPASAAPAPAQPARAPDLRDPSPERVQQIIQAFAAKEEMFRRARDMYTFHQINKVEELDADNNVTGMYEQDWDILYDDNRQRIERVTYAPTDTLKQLVITEQDLNSMRNIQPFVLTTEELPEYEIKYLGHVKVDYLTAYVFSIRPKEIKRGKEYFQGVVWVDDQDLQIVKTEGKTVPEIRPKHGEFNLFPRFTTWRQQIDGKFWFPTFTMADDTLYFPGVPPVHMREVIRYTDYKQFRSTVRTKMVVALPNGKTQEAGKAPADDKNPKN